MTRGDLLFTLGKRGNHEKRAVRNQLCVMEINNKGHRKTKTPCIMLLLSCDGAANISSLFTVAHTHTCTRFAWKPDEVLHKGRQRRATRLYALGTYVVVYYISTTTTTVV